MSIPGAASPLFLATTAGGAAGDFEISRSLRFNSADSANLSKTFGSASNRKTFTFSCWVKKSASSASNPKTLFGVYGGSAATSFTFRFDSSTDDTLRVENNFAVGAPGGRTQAVFRDYSGWMHVVLSMDTRESGISTGMKIYVNGVEQSLQNTVWTQDVETLVNSTNAHYIGSQGQANSYFDGYLTEVNFIDGSALDPTSFGAFDDNGVWQAKDTAGLTFGTNGFRLKFADNSSSAALGTDSSGNSNTWTVNNLSAGAVSSPTAKQNFDVVTYSGNSTARNIGGLAFTPDLVVIKSRSNSGYHNYWVDSVRGTNKNLYSNLTEGDHTADRLSSFNSDGFGLTNHDGVNSSGKTYVAWCWKANGSASSNTDGSGTTNVQVSANTSYGFSIVTYTGGSSSPANSDSGDSFGHGLSTAPKLVICKKRTGANSWPVYHASTALGALVLDGTNTVDTSSYLFAKKHPTSSVVYLGNNPEINNSSHNYVAYCWAEVAGFSKMSSYTGNGSSTGPIVTTGFKPRFLVTKRTDSADNWTVFDSARSLNNDLKWNTSELEGSAPVEFLSDGFQIKNTYANTNANGGTYVYMAFAATVDESAINDCFVDTPSNAAEPSDTGVGNEVVGNYATMSPVGKTKSEYFTEDGNLTCGNSSAPSGSSGNRGYVPSTIGFKTGKWYCECVTTRASDGDVDFAIGIFSKTHQDIIKMMEQHITVDRMPDLVRQAILRHRMVQLGQMAMLLV